MDYVLHILIAAAIYSILSLSLDLLAGQTGLLSMAHASLYALGAYTSGLLAVHLGAPFLVGVLAGMVIAVAVSFLISLPSFRLYDDYFIVATFACQMVILSVLTNWIALTRGPLGVPGIPEPEIAGVVIKSRLAFVVAAIVLAVLTYLVVSRVSASPFGRVLRAIREDEIITQAQAKNVLRFKVSVFAFSAALAALAGSFYAHYVTYIDPTSFTVMESILVISMVIIGGAGSRAGPVVGAVVLVSLPELLRFVGLPSSVAANVRQIIYGGLLVVFMMWRPQGLVGKFVFQLENTKK